MQALNTHIIKDLYSNGRSSEKWPSVLDQLPSIVNAKSAALILVEKNPEGLLQHQFAVTSSNMPIEQMLTYNQKFAKYEAEHLKISEQSKPGTILIDPAFDDVAEISKRPDVAFAIEHFGVRDRFGIRLNDDAAWHDAIAFQYDVNRRNVSPAEFALLQPYIPHLAQAVVLTRIYEQIRLKYNAVLTMLDRVAVGMMLLQADATVILSNQFASATIDNSAMLEISPQGKLTVKGENRDAFLNGVRNVSSNHEMPLLESDRFLLAVGDAQDNNLLIELSPLNDQESELESGLQCVIAILINPNSPVSFDLSALNALNALYGLSSSESNVAELMGQGLNQPEIAEVRDTSVETVKKQSASLFRKMKTNSRAGVIRRLMSIRLPFVD